MNSVNKVVPASLPAKRLRPYIEEAERHSDPNVNAMNLYRWNCIFSGIALSQIRNSEQHGGKTLMTVGTSPQYAYRNELKHIVLIDSTGSMAAVGDIHDYGLQGRAIPKGYLTPAYKKQFKLRKAWIAIDDLRPVKCYKGKLKTYTANNLPLPDAFGTGQLTMRYVKHQ